MKDYIVTCDYPCLIYNEIFLVSAKDVKDAISQVYEQYGNEFKKSDFKARSTGSLHNEFGKIIVLKWYGMKGVYNMLQVELSNNRIKLLEQKKALEWQLEHETNETDRYIHKQVLDKINAKLDEKEFDYFLYLEQIEQM